MRNLQEATERICELKGSLIALDALVPAVISVLSDPARASLHQVYERHAEAARTVLLHADISDLVLESFERDVARNRKMLHTHPATTTASTACPIIDGIVFATTHVKSMAIGGAMTNASGFFFRSRERLFLVTSRHVFLDVANSHRPDRIEIAIHTDAQDLTRYAVITLPLYANGAAQWREATDSGGTVDIAALQITEAELPANAVVHAFEPSHLQTHEQDVTLGDALTIVGFPLGFHDTIHHLAVARTAAVASAFGVRFQRQGYFLTDARLHRGSSGSPVVRRRTPKDPASSSLPWLLLGVHSTRMDMSSRDATLDESLGLNCAWYADVLETMTEDR